MSEEMKAFMKKAEEKLKEIESSNELAQLMITSNKIIKFLKSLPQEEHTVIAALGLTYCKTLIEKGIDDATFNLLFEKTKELVRDLLKQQQE